MFYVYLCHQWYAAHVSPACVTILFCSLSYMYITVSWCNLPNIDFTALQPALSNGCLQCTFQNHAAVSFFCMASCTGLGTCNSLILSVFIQ